MKLKIEFTLKDRNGVELNEGDKVNWICENLSVEECTFGNMVNKMWNSGEVIKGKLVFYKTNEQVRDEFINRPYYKKYINNPNESYRVSSCPSNIANLELMFLSDEGDIRWSIKCPSVENDYRHEKLEKVYP